MVTGGVGSLSWKLVYWFAEKSWPVSCHGLKNDLCTGLELVETANSSEAPKSAIMSKHASPLVGTN